MQKFGYHTHTTFSDGQNTIEEMLDQAIKLGFEQIGISDHLMVHKNIKQSPSWEEIKDNAAFSDFESIIDLCNKHADQIRLQGKQRGIKTLVGYEVDYFTYNGWEDEFKAFIKKIDFDYLINGNHFFMNQNGEDVFNIWSFNSKAALEDVTVYLKRHFETMCKAVNSGMFNFLAHIDYAQKMPEYKQEDYMQQIDEVLAALKKTNTGCEISTKGIRKFGHCYPSESILAKLIKQNTPIVISDDAHHISELGSYFEDAEKILKRLNCQRRLKL